MDAVTFTSQPMHWAWMLVAIPIWGYWLRERGSRPWGAADVAIAWGLIEVTILIIVVVTNAKVVRVTAGEVVHDSFRSQRRIPRGEIESVHFWQRAVQPRDLSQGGTQPSWSAGVKLRNGPFLALLTVGSRIEDSESLAQLIGERLRLPVTHEPAAARGEEIEWAAWGWAVFGFASPIAVYVIARLAWGFAT